jgi:hypothetical protein
MPVPKLPKSTVDFSFGCPRLWFLGGSVRMMGFKSGLRMIWGNSTGSLFDNYADVVTKSYYRPTVRGHFVEEERHL